MQRALVLGAGGFIGNAISLWLATSGVEVYCGARKTGSGEAIGAISLQVDRDDPHSVLSALKANNISLLIDVVAWTGGTTSTLLEAVEDQLQRYVLISSADVYRNYGLIHRKESGLPDPGLLAEDAPLRTGRFPYRGATLRALDDPQAWLDQYDKILVEEAVRQARCTWTILRLPMVFGPGDPQARFRWVVGPMLKGESNLDVPGAWLDWTTTYDDVANVGAAVAAATVSDAAANCVFNIATFAPVSHRIWLERLQAATGWHGTVRESAEPTHPLARMTSQLDLSVPLTISGKRLFEVLRFRPPCKEAAAISRLLPPAATG